MAFAVAPKRKRVKFLDPEGHETLEDDDPYVFLRYEAAGVVKTSKHSKTEAPKAPEGVPAQQGAADAADANATADPTEAASEDEAADPAPALEALRAAQQELTVMIDLIDSVAGQSAIGVQYVEAGKDSKELWSDAAKDVKATQQRLDAGAARLRGAAATLRQHVHQDAVFVQELAQLQAYWRLQPTAGSAFTAVIAFPISLAPDRTIAPAAQRPPLPPYKHVRIMPGLSGAAITSVAPPEEPPTVRGDALGSAQAKPAGEVAVGAAQVHSFLLKTLQHVLRDAVIQRCQWELAQEPQAPFVRTVVQKVVALLHSEQLSDAEASLRCALQERMLTQLTPGPDVTAAPVLLPLIMACAGEAFAQRQLLNAIA